MRYTKKLKLKLPDYRDTADIADINENFEKVDEAIEKIGDNAVPGGGQDVGLSIVDGQIHVTYEDGEEGE